MARENKDKLQKLEVLLRFKFADVALLQQALVHSSYGFEQLDNGINNETLEFLGDAVLDLAVSDMLFHLYPGIREGELTKMRAELVKEASLARMAGGIKLSDFLMLGKGEEASHGRMKFSILAGAFEALVGAVYLDGGYETALHFINAHFAPMLPAKKEKMLVDDAKSLLQEKLQEQFNRAPTYHLDTEEGPDHAKKFTVSVRFISEVLGVGTGSSKKAAEQQAAETALATLDSWWKILMKLKIPLDK
ncbi:MAG: ribonuclease III [Desulfobacterales bacterium SG8_35_2]|nr:MAG: ribonuclease III [Desulfobacterales bacterium SG8_35_2]